MLRRVVVVLPLLGSACLMASAAIKPSRLLPYPALVLWVLAIILFNAALVMALRLRATSGTRP